jgi:hypothetical protein
MELTLVVDLQAKLARLMEARGTDLTAAVLLRGSRIRPIKAPPTRSPSEPNPRSQLT